MSNLSMMSDSRVLKKTSSGNNSIDENINNTFSKTLFIIAKDILNQEYFDNLSPKDKKAVQSIINLPTINRAIALRYFNSGLSPTQALKQVMINFEK